MSSRLLRSWNEKSLATLWMASKLKDFKDFRIALYIFFLLFDLQDEDLVKTQSFNINIDCRTILE